MFTKVDHPTVGNFGIWSATSIEARLRRCGGCYINNCGLTSKHWGYSSNDVEMSLKIGLFSTPMITI
jgi:hypothetical protein